MFRKFRPALNIALFVVLIAPLTQASAQMAPPFVKKHLYDSTANPKVDIAEG